VIPLDDAPAAGGRRAAVREREEAVVASLRSLGTALDGEPDPAFREATRARLVAMAAVRTPGLTPEPRSLLSRLTALRPEPARSPVRRRLTAALAGGALAVTAVATLVAVSTGATPGDPLYDLKRGTEQTQLALSGSDRGLTLLGFAHTRLTELASLTGSGDTALAVETLRDMDEQTAAGAAAVAARAVAAHDPATARSLATWSADRSGELAALRPRLPAGAQPDADQTTALLTRVADRGSALATAIGCASGPAIGGTDPLGPVPLACGGTPTNAPTPTGGATGGSTGSGGSAPIPGTTGTPATPTPTPGTGSGTGGVIGSGGTGTGGTRTGGAGTGGGTAPTVPGLPTSGLPSLPTTGLPHPGSGSGGPVVPPSGPSALPNPGTLLPTLPKILPGTGSTAGSPSAGSSPSTGTGTTGLPGVSVCVPPVTIGNC
jgi:Domain of unknown function (DUF5667)